MQDARALDPSAYDLVMVASLVPKDDLAAVARRVAGCGPGGPVLLARSARGLASQLAYEPVDLDMIDRCGLAHLGTVAPAGSVSPLPLPPGLVIRPGPLLRHVAGPGVLNTTEYFAVR